MRFKTGFVLGAAAGAWAAARASQLRPTRRSVPGGASFDAAETAEKLRAVGDLARERLADIAESPFGALAKERITQLIGSSLGSSGRHNATRKLFDPSHSTANGHDPTIDTTARWPR